MSYLLVQQCLHHVVGNLGTESPKAERQLSQLLSGADRPCLSPHPNISPTADPTDLIQTALIGFPLVFIGLSKC